MANIKKRKRLVLKASDWEGLARLERETVMSPKAKFPKRRGTSMKRIRQAACLSVAVLALGIVVPSAPQPAMAAETAPTKVRIVATFINSLPAMAALEVAYKRGYFKDADLDLTFASAIGGGDTLRPVTTGDADVAIGSPAASVLAVEHNPGLRIAAIWVPYNAFTFIGIKPLKELEGAKLGGSVGASTVNLLIDGLQEKMKVKFVNQRAGTGSMADNWAAVKAGHLDASWAAEPFTSEKEASDGALVVIDPVKYLPDFPMDFVVVNEKFAKTHATAMKEFFVAIERIFKEFPDRSKQGALAKDLAGVMVFPEPVLEHYLTSSSTDRLSKTYSLKMNAGVLHNISHIMQLAKLIKAPVDWSKAIDQSYLPAADQIAKF